MGFHAGGLLLDIHRGRVSLGSSQESNHGGGLGGRNPLRNELPFFPESPV